MLSFGVIIFRLKCSDDAISNNKYIVLDVRYANIELTHAAPI